MSENSYHHALWKAFKSGYACGMDHDKEGDGFAVQAEEAFQAEFPAQHARLTEDWRKAEKALAS